MAYDRYDSLYHLTPRGWEQSDDDIPHDRVETWNLSVEQASGWSKEQRSWSLVWENPNVSIDNRDGLRKQYGDHPR